MALILISTFSLHSISDEIYKTVDEDGNVSYSTEPPESHSDSSVVDLLPEPDEEDVQAAQERLSKIEQELEQIEQANREKAKAQQEQQEQNESSTTVIYSNPAVVPLYVPPYYWREREHYDRWRHRPVHY